MAYATRDDYEDRHGPATTDQQIKKINAKLQDATALIRSVLPAGYTPAAELTRALCVAITYRAITNPGGLRSQTVGGVSRSFGEDGGLYLTEAEERMLLAAHTAASATAYTVDLRDDGLRDCPQPGGEWW